MLEKSLKLLEYHKGDEHTATAIVVLWNFCLKRFSEGTNKDMKGMKKSDEDLES